jgi:peptidoglycan-associated lipoprotein
MKNQISLFFLSFLLLISACTYTQKIKDGRTAFERKQYSVAIPFLKKEYEKEKSKVIKGQLAFLIGESYRKMNRPEDAIRWYDTAYNYQFGLDALKQYAYALKQTEQYIEAMDAFKNLGIELGSPYEYRKEIKACEIAAVWKKDAKKSRYKVRLSDLNSSASDYSPSLYGKDQIAFTSDRGSAMGEEPYNWTGKNYSDIFVADASGFGVSPIDLPINTENNEGTIAFNAANNEVYFTRCFSPGNQDAYCKLMVSKRDGDAWSEPVPLNFIKEGVNYGHPALSADGSTLYFSCNDPQGWGGYDIYFAERTPDGWGEPRLMNRSINTPQDEKFPAIDKDTLYFSSSGHTGMGGLDIYRSYKLGNSTWSPAYNLKPPINSAADDFGFVPDRRELPEKGTEVLGYFTSSRPNGAGGDDIYIFERMVAPPEPPQEEKEEEIVYKILLDGFVLEKIYSLPGDPNSEVLGRKPLPGATVKALFGEQTSKFKIGQDGKFSLELEENTDYNFTAEAENYLTNAERFSTKGIGKDPSNPVLRFEIEIVLDKIFVNKEIRLENIYYDFDEAYIRDDAKPTLDELSGVLLQNPDIRIELGSHTDCRGGNRYNQELSQRRAQSAVDYLISKGVSDDRLYARGYGENVPANDCGCASCTEEEHQENRRTTFKIVEE